MANVGFATLSVIPSLQGFEGALKSQVGGPINSVAGAAGAEASQSFGSRFTSGLQSLASQAGKIITAGFAVGAAGAAVLGGALIKTGVAYNTLEQSSLAAFTTILGSSEAAAQMQDSIRKFALTSPFPRQAFIEGTQQLLGFGVSAEQIIPTLSAIQDSVAAIGGNANDISQVTFALAQVKGQGKLTGETLNQLGQFGIDAASILGKQFGKTGAEIRDMASKPGGIPADQVFDPLVKGLTEKFGGAAAGLKNTFTGALDRVKGAFRDIASDLAEPFVSKKGGGAAVEWANTLADVMRKIQATIVPVLAAALSGLAGRITPFVNRFRDFITNLSTDQIQGFLKRVFDGFDKVRDLFGKIGPLVAGAFSALGTFGAGGLPFIGPLLSGISPLLAGFVAIAATSPAIRDAFKSILPIVARLAKTLGTALAPVLPVIAGALGDVAGFVADLIAAGIEALAPIFQAIVDAVVPLIPIFTDLITSLRGPLLAVLGELTPVLSDLAVTLGGALADAVNEIAPVLPGLADTLGQVAVSVGTSLAGALTSLAPALPAFADLVAIAADLIAKVPPDVLAAIVLGFLAFRGVQSVIAPVKGLADTFGSLTTKFNDFFKAGGTKDTTGFFRLFDNLPGVVRDIGAALKDLPTKIAVRLGFETAVGEGVAGAAGEGAASGIGAKLKPIFAQIGAATAAFAVANPIALPVTLVVSSVVLFGLPDTINPSKLFDETSLTRTIFRDYAKKAGQIVDLAKGVWDDVWDQQDLISADLGDRIGNWFSSQFSNPASLPDIDFSGIASAIGDWLDPSQWLADLGSAQTWITDLANGLEDIIKDVLDGGIGDVLDGFEGWVSDAVGSINFDWVGSIIDGIFGGGDSGGKSKGGVAGGSTLGAIDTSFLTDAFQPVIDWFADLPNKISDALGEPFNWIKDKGVAVITGFITGIGEGVLQVAQFVIGLPQAISDWIGDTGTTLLDKGLALIGGFLGGIGQKTLEVANFIIGLPAAIVGWIGNTLGTLIQKGVALIAGFFAGIIQKASEVFDWFRGLPQRIVDAIPAIGGILKDAGVAIMHGLRDGIEQGAGSVLGKVRDVVGEAVHAITHPWEINSPSKLTMRLGHSIMEGLGLGISGSASIPLQALTAVSKSMTGVQFTTPKTNFQPIVPAPAISQRDLAALQTLSIEAVTATDTTESSRPLVHIEHMNALNGREAAVNISREQSWAEKTSGRDD